MAIGGEAEVVIVIPADAHDLPGFLRWVHSDAFPDRGNIAFVSGELLIDRSPERIDSHSKVKGQIYLVLSLLASERDYGEVFPDGVMVVNEATGLACEPDVIYCSWASQDSGRVQYEEAGPDTRASIHLNGSPDLVVEILSNSSVRKDTVALFAGYYAAGIDEYWLIDARDEEIDFQLFVRGDDEFVAVDADAEGYRHSGVFDTAFKLTRSTNRRGRVQYRLLHR